MEESAEKTISFKIRKPALIATIIILLAFFFLEAQVTLNSPIVFGDEGFHAEMAVWMASHLEYPKWVPFEITPQIMTGYWRTPFWNTLQASFFLLSGNSEAALKIMTPLISLLSGLAVYLLVKRLYNPNIGFFASIIAFALPSILTYSVLLYYSIVTVFYFVLFFFTFVLAERLQSTKYLYLSAFFAFLALMSDRVAIVAYFIIFVAFLYRIVKKDGIKLMSKKYGPIFFILIVLLVPYFVRNLALYDAPVCFTLPIINRYFQLWNVNGCNVDTLNSQLSFAGQAIPTGTEQTVVNLGITNYLDFAYGNDFLINIFVLGVVAGLILLILKRDDILLPVAIVLLSIIGLFVSSSERAEDLSRFTLIFAPILALLAAVFWDELYNSIKRYQKYLVLGVFVFIIILSYNNLVQKLPSLASIKQFSPTFFQACNWIKQNTPADTTTYTIWGHNAAYNCNRNIATNIPDVVLAPNVSYELNVLKQNDINYIFIQKFSIDTQNRGYADNYPLNFITMLVSNNQTFQNVYENGPDLNTCLQQGGCDGEIVYKVNLS
jgi:hypothetical protein